MNLKKKQDCSCIWGLANSKLHLKSLHIKIYTLKGTNKFLKPLKCSHSLEFVLADTSPIYLNTRIPVWHKEPGGDR